LKIYPELITNSFPQANVAPSGASRTVVCKIESAIVGHIVFSTGIVILSFVVKTSVL